MNQDIKNHTAVELLAEIALISQKTELDLQLKSLFFFFKLLVESLTTNANISFNTLFARVAFLGIQEQLPSKLLYALHDFRRGNALKNLTPEDKKSLLETGYYAILHLLKKTHDLDIPEALLAQAQAPDFKSSTIQKDFVKASRGVITSVDPQQKQFKFIAEADGLSHVTVCYDIPQRNQIFTAGIERLHNLSRLPMDVQLLDIQIDNEDLWRPAAIIINPDYLVDVTAVAELYDAEGAELMHYLLKKFMPQTPSKGLLLGNIANFLLDELMSNPDIEIESLYQRIFANYPLIFSVYDNTLVAEVISSAKTQFANLKTRH